MPQVHVVAQLVLEGHGGALNVGKGELAADLTEAAAERFFSIIVAFFRAEHVP